MDGSDLEHVAQAHNAWMAELLLDFILAGGVLHVVGLLFVGPASVKLMDLACNLPIDE